MVVCLQCALTWKFIQPLIGLKRDGCILAKPGSWLLPKELIHLHSRQPSVGSKKELHPSSWQLAGMESCSAGQLEMQTAQDQPAAWVMYLARDGFWLFHLHEGSWAPTRDALGPQLCYGQHQLGLLWGNRERVWKVFWEVEETVTWGCLGNTWMRWDAKALLLKVWQMGEEMKRREDLNGSWQKGFSIVFSVIRDP